MADHVVTTVAQLNTALAAAVAGDNILVRAGYYQTTNSPADVRQDGGFHFSNSGTSGNPITLKPYPGDAVPTLANRPIGTTSYFAFPTITTGQHSYITIDGIKVDGAIYLYDNTFSITGTAMSNGQTGNIVKNCEIIEGWETIAAGGDGNWTGIYGCGQTVLLLRNNYIHDINNTGNCNNLSSMCGIKLFSCIDSITEYNTVRRVVGYSQAACLDDKQDSIRNTHRFNWFEDVSTGPRIQNQSSSGASGATGTKFYQNVIILGNYNGRAFTHESGLLTDYEFYNNTIVVQQGSVVPGSDDGMVYSGTADDGAKFYNNIFYSPTSSKNMASYTAIFGGGGLCDYNHYSDSTLDFRYGATTYTDLTAFQAVFDAAASSGDPVFTNLGALNLTLGGGSPCLNTGKVGGVIGGSNINKGAYLTGSEQIGYSAATGDISTSLQERIEIDDIGQGRAAIGTAALRVRDILTVVREGGGGTLTASLQELIKIVDADDSWAQLGKDEYAVVRDLVSATLIPFVVSGGLQSVNIELGLGGRVRDIINEASFTMASWPLSELFSTVLRDASGNLNHAVLSGSGATRGVPTGLPEQAMGLTSNGSVILTVADDGITTGGINLANGSMDIAGFIKTTTNDATERLIITNRNASSQGWYVGFISGAIRWRYRTPGGVTVFDFTRGNLADGVLHSYHCYYDPPTQQAWITIDGAVSGLVVSTTNTDPAYIGVGLKIMGGDPAGASGFIGMLAFQMIGREGDPTLGPRMDAARQWTNVAGDVRIKDGLLIRYGSSGRLATDWIASSGTCSFVLDNSIGNSAAATGYYSPNHASCRQGFQLGIPVRVSFSYVTTTRYKFQGRIVSIAPDGGVLGQRGVHITAADWMDVAARSRFIGAETQVGQLSTDCLKYLLDFADQSPGNVSIATGTQIFGYALDQGRGERDTILSEMNRLAPSEMMYCYMRGNDTDGMTFVVDTRFGRSADLTLDATFTDSMSALEMGKEVGGILNEVRATCYPPTVDAAATSVLFSLIVSTDVPHSIPPLGTITIDAPFTDPADRPSGVGGTAMVTPVATTDYTGNSSPDGSGADRTSSLTVTAAAGSTSRRIIITNSHYDTVFITKLQLRGKGIYRYQAAPAIAVDNESIRKYGTSSIDIDMPYQQNINTAQSLARAVADIYSQPTTRPQRVTLPANHDDATMVQALTREIGDHIGIVETVSGIVAGSGYFIHEVDLECRGLKDLRVSWGLIPAWPERLLVSVSGPAGDILHDLNGSPLVLTDVGDYTFTFNRTGDTVAVRGVAGGGGGGQGSSGSPNRGGGGGAGGTCNLTGINVAIATTVYTGKVGAGGTEVSGPGTAGGTTEFRVPAGTIHMQLPGGGGGGEASGGTPGAAGVNGGAGTGSGNVAGSNGGSDAAGANNASGAAGGGAGKNPGSAGFAGGNSIDQTGATAAADGAPGNTPTGGGAGGGEAGSGSSGAGGGGGGGLAFVGGYFGGGAGGGAGATVAPGNGGTAAGGALTLTKV